MIEPQPAPAPELDDEAALRALLAGKIAGELGLTGDDLRIGLTIARNLMKRGAHAEALRAYGVLVLCEPTNIDFQIGLANCASMVGAHLVAIQAASALIVLAPRDPRGYLLSARGCLGISDLAAAREDLEDARRLSAGQPSHAAVEREATLLLARLDMNTAS